MHAAEYNAVSCREKPTNREACEIKWSQEEVFLGDLTGNEGADEGTNAEEAADGERVFHVDALVPTKAICQQAPNDNPRDGAKEYDEDEEWLGIHRLHMVHGLHKGDCPELKTHLLELHSCQS